MARQAAKVHGAHRGALTFHLRAGSSPSKAGLLGAGKPLGLAGGRVGPLDQQLGDQMP